MLFEEFYKVSDEIYAEEDLIGAIVNTTIEGLEEFTVNSVGHFGDVNSFYVVIESEAAIVINLEEDAKGVYFLKHGDIYVTSLTQSARTREVVHRIDEKYSSDFVIKGTITPNEDDEGDEYIVTITTPVSDIMANWDRIKYCELVSKDDEEIKMAYCYTIGFKQYYAGQIVLMFQSYRYGYSDFGPSRMLSGFTLSAYGNDTYCQVDFIDVVESSRIVVNFTIRDGVLTSRTGVDEVKHAMKETQRHAPMPVIGVLGDYDENADGLGACVLFKGEPAFDYLGNDKFRITAENGQWVLNSAE